MYGGNGFTRSNGETEVTEERQAAARVARAWIETPEDHAPPVLSRGACDPRMSLFMCRPVGRQPPTRAPQLTSAALRCSVAPVNPLPL